MQGQIETVAQTTHATARISDSCFMPVHQHYPDHRRNTTRLRALLSLEAEDGADMSKKDGGRYGAKTAKVNWLKYFSWGKENPGFFRVFQGFQGLLATLTSQELYDPVFH